MIYTKMVTRSYTTTARGSTTDIDWKDLTTKQLSDWNAKYHKLILGKPYADYYIDDKSDDIFDWF